MIAVTTEAYMARLAGTLPTVRDRIARAVSSADRAQGSVRMVAVTKSHPFAAVEAAIEAELTDLGENRVEELEGKVAEFGAEAATWHMIGHLQSRKAVRASRVADVIHSIDSLRLAERISRDASADGGAATVLVQVNTSGESSKSGFDVARATEEVHQMAELPGLNVKGLMTMAPFVDDEVVVGHAFGELRRLSERLCALTDRVGGELSMGMTNDMEIAIREGSTMVRIGTALFGPRIGSVQ